MYNDRDTGHCLRDALDGRSRVLGKAHVLHSLTGAELNLVWTLVKLGMACGGSQIPTPSLILQIFSEAKSSLRVDLTDTVSLRSDPLGTPRIGSSRNFSSPLYGILVFALGMWWNVFGPPGTDLLLAKLSGYAL